MAYLLNRCRFTAGSSGTADFTDGTAVTGFENLANAGAVTTRIYPYAAENATRTQWEIGYGTYDSGSGVLERTTVVESSTGSKINFTTNPVVFVTPLLADIKSIVSAQYRLLGRSSSGAGDIEEITTSAFILTVLDDASAAAAQVTLGVREVLTANRTYYVRADGSDSNTGLANTSGGAFLTVQKAVNVIAGTLDLAGYTATVQIGDGTYTGTVTLKEVVGYSAPGCLVIQGNNGTPANVIISTTSADCFAAGSIRAVWDIKDLEMRTTTSGDCLRVTDAFVRFGNVRYGTCAGSNIAMSAGGKVSALSNYTISGNALAHINNIGISFCDVSGRTITLSGTPAFSSAFVITNYCSLTWIFTMTFTGSATGVRYSAGNNGVIFTNAGGASYLPGNSAGSVASGAQYT